MADPTFAVTVIDTGSPHFVTFTTPNGMLAYTFTGIVLIDFKGTGPDIFRTSLQFSIPIPGLSPGQGLKLFNWAPFVTLSAISNDGPAIDALWAVDEFSIDSPERALPTVAVNCKLAVRDIDGRILRLSYVV